MASPSSRGSAGWRCGLLFQCCLLRVVVTSDSSSDSKSPYTRVGRKIRREATAESVSQGGGRRTRDVADPVHDVKR